MFRQRQWQWMVLSAALLLLYLTFFHLCIDASYFVCNVLGISFWLTWSVICWQGQALFKNRFEYWIHQLVGLDVLFEGFSPLHEGFGFYFCALSFWTVFLIYHFGIAQPAVFEGAELKPEQAESSVVA